MNNKGYQVLIDNAYPNHFAFDEALSLQVALSFNPNASTPIKKRFRDAKCEPLSSSEISHILAACDASNRRPRKEKIASIKQELSDYWKKREQEMLSRRQGVQIA